LWFDAERGRFIAFVLVLYGVGSGGYSALLPTTIAEVINTVAVRLCDGILEIL